MAVRTRVLAAVHAPTGLLQLIAPYDTLVGLPRMGALGDLSPRGVRLLGAAQLSAGAVLATRTPRPVQAAAAAGLVLVQLGAAVAHVRRREFPVVPVNLALAAAAGSVVADGRAANRAGAPG